MYIIAFVFEFINNVLSDTFPCISFTSIIFSANSYFPASGYMYRPGLINKYIWVYQPLNMGSVLKVAGDICYKPVFLVVSRETFFRLVCD